MDKYRIIAGSAVTYAQGTFKIPFKFEAAGKSFPTIIAGSGSYVKKAKKNAA